MHPCSYYWSLAGDVPTVQISSLIRIALVDALPIVRLALRALFEADARFIVVAEAASGQALARVIRDAQPCVIVLDTMLSDGASLNILATLKRRGICLPAILLFSETCLEDDVRYAHTLGIQGFLLKTGDGYSTLVQAAADAKRGVPTFDAEFFREGSSQ